VPDHDSSGDTLSPTQSEFCGFLLATFFGIMVPFLKVVEESVNAACAFALLVMHHQARIKDHATARKLCSRQCCSTFLERAPSERWVGPAELISALCQRLLEFQQPTGIGHYHHGAEIVQQRRDERTARAEHAGCRTPYDHDGPTKADPDINMNGAPTSPA
jgi:hypothetical protein